MLFKRWLLASSFLVAVTLVYRVVFTVYHQQILTEQPLAAQIYALLWGLRFDIALAMPMALLSLFIHRILHIFPAPWFFYVSLWVPLLCVIQTGDILYFQDSGRHVSYEILSANTDTIELLQHALHTGLSLIILNLTLLVTLTFFWFKYAGHVFSETTNETLLKKSSMALLIFICTAVGVRGGISGVPQEPINAYQIGDANLALIASNSAYITIFILTSGENGAEQAALPASELNQADILRILYPENYPAVALSPTKQNIILIYLESWNAAFMQSYNPDETLDITPNFDRFRRSALSSDLTLAGGHRTVEGVFSSLCSLQNPLGTSIAKNHLLNFPYLCLPEILNQQQYATYFIQGSFRDTGGVGSFAQRIGFKESLGKDELPSGKLPNNSWGLQDDDLYDIVLNKALKQQKPFFFAVNTTSTHDTILPPHAAPLMKADSNEAKHKNMMHYADQAFGRFIERFHNSQLAENTILVAVADHTAQVHGSYLHEYMVPMAIKIPNTARQHIPHATSQRDIAPTLLEILQLPAAPSFAGKSLLSSDVYFADYYHNKHIGWIEDDYLLNINTLDHSVKCYRWRRDTLLNNPVACDSHKDQLQHALAFTTTMQNHLYQGTTKNLLLHHTSKAINPPPP